MVNLKWNGEDIEELRTYIYLGHTLKANNYDESDIKAVVGKSKAVMGIMWSIGEKLVKDQWQLKMKLFEAPVWGIVLYGAEVWG